MEEQLQALAREALSHFEMRGSSYYVIGDDVPVWVRQLVQHAHDGMLPDDWRYKFIVASLDAISCGDFEGDSLAPSCYTCELTDWLASDIPRLAYCDEARETYELNCNMFGLLQAGQAAELREVFSLVRQFLEELALDDEHAATLGDFYGAAHD